MWRRFRNQGKTTLPEEFATGHLIDSLSQIEDPAKLSDTDVQDLVAYLRERQLLLLLDPFEHLLPAAPLLTELLSACPQLKIMVTSRAALHVQGEYELVVPPLAALPMR